MIRSSADFADDQQHMPTGAMSGDIPVWRWKNERKYELWRRLLSLFSEDVRSKIAACVSPSDFVERPLDTVEAVVVVSAPHVTQNVEEMRGSVSSLVCELMEEERQELLTAPSFEQQIQWQILPAVRAVALDDTRDLSPLQDVAVHLPEDRREGFLAALQHIEGSPDMPVVPSELFGKLAYYWNMLRGRKDVHNLQRRCARVLQALNDHWLEDHHLYLSSSEQFWQQLLDCDQVEESVMPARIMRSMKHCMQTVGNHAVRIVFSIDYPFTSGAFQRAAYFDPLQGHVLHSIAALEMEAHALLKQSRRIRSEEGIGRHDFNAETLVRRYRGLPMWRFMEDIGTRTLIEELRHASDRQQVEMRQPLLTPYETQKKYVSVLLQKGGVLSSVARTLGHGAALAQFGHSCFELSGQMTACATSENPSLVLYQWKNIHTQMAKSDKEEQSYYVDAARLGILLTASQLGLFSGHKSSQVVHECRKWISGGFECHQEVLAIVEQLLQVPHEHIRLAQKELWEKEMALGSIDVQNFRSINSDGTLQQPPRDKTLSFHMPEQMRALYSQSIT